MAIPFTVDISAFYGEPDFREQDSGTIVDRRKTLNLHKELEAPVQSKRGKCNQREGRNEERRSELRRKELELLLSMGRPLVAREATLLPPPRTPVEPLLLTTLTQEEVSSRGMAQIAREDHFLPNNRGNPFPAIFHHFLPLSTCSPRCP